MSNEKINLILKLILGYYFTIILVFIFDELFLKKSILKYIDTIFLNYPLTIIFICLLIIVLPTGIFLNIVRGIK